MLLRHLSRLLLGAGFEYKVYRVFTADTWAGRGAAEANVAVNVDPDPDKAPGQILLGLRDGDRQPCRCELLTGPYYRQARNYFPLAADEAELVLLETDGEARGRGLAPRLLAAVPRLAPSPLRRIYARVWHSNTPSVRAFAKAGWRQAHLRIDFGRRGHMRTLRLPIGQPRLGHRRETS